MSLNLINPLNAITTNASRISHNTLVTKGSELSSGLKDKKNNITDHMIGDNLKNSAQLMNAMKSNSVYAANITKQAKSSLDHVSNTIKNIQELIVTASSSNDTSKVNYLDNRYKSEVSSLINYIDQAKFHDTNLFNGDLNDLTVRVGENINHTMDVSIPKLLITYQDLGVTDVNKYEATKTDSKNIEDEIKDISNEIRDQKNKIDTRKKEDDECSSLKGRKATLENDSKSLLQEIANITKELDQLNQKYNTNKSQLEKELDLNKQEEQKLVIQKQDLTQKIDAQKPTLGQEIKKLEKTKEDNQNVFVTQNSDLANQIVDKTKELSILSDQITKITGKIAKNQKEFDEAEQQITQLSDETTQIKDKIKELEVEEKKAVQESLKLNNEQNNNKKEFDKITTDIAKIEKRIQSVTTSSKNNQVNLIKTKVDLNDCKKLETTYDKELLNLKEQHSAVQKLNNNNNFLKGLDNQIISVTDSKETNKKNIITLENNKTIIKTNIQNAQNKIIEKENELNILQQKQKALSDGFALQQDSQKANEKLQNLDKKIAELKDTVIQNNTTKKNLENENSKISQLLTDNNKKKDNLEQKKGLIDIELTKLKQDQNNLSKDNTDANNKIDQEIKDLNDKFNIDNSTLLKELSDTQQEIQTTLSNIQITENKISTLDKTYNSEKSKLEKQEQENKQKIADMKTEISDLDKKIANINNNQTVVTLQNLESTLTQLEQDKQTKEKELSAKKSEIEDFTKDSHDRLKDHGGLFIREALENSSLIDNSNIRESEKMIDIIKERLLGINSNINQTESFLSTASDKLTSTINLLNEVSDDYLSTNYEEAASKYKEALQSLRVQMSIRSQGDMIMGELLKRIENT